jgi:transposase, IS6 family
VAESDPFKWRHYKGEIILLCLRKYLNNIVEQDRRFIKRRINPGLGFFSCNTARWTIGGDEVMNMIRKGQVEGIVKGDIRGQVRFVERLFKVAA